MDIAVDWDSENYNETLLAFGRVIHLINQIVDYPKGELNPEYAHQYELKSHHYLVFSPIQYLKMGLTEAIIRICFNLRLIQGTEI